MSKQLILKLRKIGSDIKILYVEDSDPVAIQTELLLRKIFQNIDVASDGEKGLDLYRKNQYHIVITDIEMPNMNGIEMIEHIKKINNEQIIVVTSAYDNPQNLLKLIEIGIDKFILKPLDSLSLLKLISKIVVEIYNEKKVAQKEKEVTSLLQLNNALLDRMDTPIVVLEDNIVKYANQKFMKFFNSEGTAIELDRFKLKDLFTDDSNLNLSNEGVLQQLIFKNKSVKNVFMYNLNEVHRYRIDVSSIESNNKHLLSFHNVEKIYSEIDKLKSKSELDPITFLFSKETFENKLASLLQNKEQYSVVCFGIKHIKEPMGLFGVKKLVDIFSVMGSSLKNHFKSEIFSGLFELYYFDANYFVALVKEGYVDEMKELLKSFASTFEYTDKKGKKYDSMVLDMIHLALDKKHTVQRNMDEIDNRLYLLKGQVE
ncbi:response regulator [Sulfurimonas sp.]|nr:response regulator [Sulfurimonas sp.]